MAGELNRSVEMLGWPEMGETYEEGYQFGAELAGKGFDGIWSQIYTATEDVAAMEAEVFKPENRERLRDTEQLGSRAVEIGKILYQPEAVIDSLNWRMNQQLGDRNGAIIYKNIDLSRLLDLSETERRILSPDGLEVIEPEDAAVYLADAAPMVLGAVHAFKDLGQEARLLGLPINSLPSRLEHMLRDAIDSLIVDTVYLNEPAKDCIPAMDNIEHVGFAAVALMAYRDFECGVRTVAAQSGAQSVAFTGSPATQYEAHSERFQGLMEEHGFSVKGTIAPDSTATQETLDMINADKLVPVKGDDHEFRTRLGVLAYLLATKNYTVDRDWFGTYRPVVMEVVTEEDAKRGWEEFLHIQHEGYMLKSQVEAGHPKGKITHEYQNRMRKLCDTWMPGVLDLDKAAV